jgi:signal peptidase
MTYNTIEYLSDSLWLIDRIVIFVNSLHPKVKSTILKIRLKIASVNYRKYKRNISKNLFSGLLIVYLGVLAVGMLATQTEKSDGVRFITLSSGSMEPKIPSPSVVITTSANNYKIGDIITYKEVSEKTGFEFSRTITHRIIDIQEDDGKKYFITKGDANQLPDPQRVSENEILGKVAFIFPYLGYVTLTIKTLPGFLFMVAAPSYLLIKNELRYISKEIGFEA